MADKELSELILTVLLALACPLVLPVTGACAMTDHTEAVGS